MEEHGSQPGTYYYTRGWIEYIDDPYAEYKQIVPKYGEEKARRIALMIMNGYTRVALIDTGSYPLEEYEPYVREVSEFYSLPVEHLVGSLRYIEKLVKGPHDGVHRHRARRGTDERIFWSHFGQPVRLAVVHCATSRTTSPRTSPPASTQRQATAAPAGCLPELA
jgi:hypothetical protein